MIPIRTSNEEEDYEEVYATLRVRITPYTTNRRDAKKKNIKEAVSILKVKNLEEKYHISPLLLTN
ncbi:14461_t:CDS:2 [Funneliformis mosseae]|uniref:14461_t:CDS:1 n=1 Tax=Funneliformis mosseae TaxID=27381 RepID=A0A9N9GUR0_FUNMO|nr:14461_t:CDS:2 [Funneliformis mosseae]